MQNLRVMVDELRLLPDYKKQGTNTTPWVECVSSTGRIAMGGVSMPENVSAFYTPILNWVKRYCAQPAQDTVLRFAFDYFNTATSKIFMEIISYLEHMVHEGHSCHIEWVYDPDDRDMREAGEDYAMLTAVPFRFIEGEKNRDEDYSL